MCLNELHTSLIYIHTLQAKTVECLDEVKNLTSNLFSQAAQEPRNTGRDEIVKVWVGNVGLNPKLKQRVSEHLESWTSTANLVCICFVFSKTFPYGLILDFNDGFIRSTSNTAQQAV